MLLFSFNNSLYDEGKLSSLTQKQKDLAWDLERSIQWNTPIDFSKPLVPLDDHALLFPGASKEQRLVISQMMGLIIAACICEMEESLLRLRKLCWDQVHQRFPVNPEFEELGTLFFEEEHKHSSAFRRYLVMFSEQAGIDFKTLFELLPCVEKTRSEYLLRKNLEHGGQSFWWIVAIVEQQFLLLYKNFAPFKKSLEPLYFDLHKKHFEEEARHAPFPYLVLELLATRNHSLTSGIHTRTDLAYAQFIQSAWALSSLQKLHKVKKLRKKHPFFDTLASVFPLFEKQSPVHVLWKMLTRTHYVGSLINIAHHRNVSEFAKKMGAYTFPMPQFEPDPLVREHHSL